MSAVIAARDETIAQNNNIIAARNKTITAKDEEIQALKAEITKLTAVDAVDFETGQVFSAPASDTKLGKRKRAHGDSTSPPSQSGLQALASLNTSHKAITVKIKKEKVDAEEDLVDARETSGYVQLALDNAQSTIGKLKELAKTAGADEAEIREITENQTTSKKRDLKAMSKSQWTVDELWSRRVDYKDYNRSQLREECKRFGMSVEALKG
eukprot:CAMPEP_0182458562 /NCGR_PEP_ID=MMETSP1319-20130603/3880_1 /TAXON_ID=172717 /ORGANISM="Bolidomonas pacifica, Strain RCC208" /LENGTH=210 /DNA_ID=CAMNT_0024657269 /DNA_START=1 /DNA_END=630 /DNA_ORIENTATION=+